MRKITIVVSVLLLAGLAGSAYAQSKGDSDYDLQREAKARDAATLDKQYRTILELTDKPTDVKVDPWRNMRGPATDNVKN
jgi:hypothetical protein